MDEGAIDLGDGSIIFSNNESAKVTGGALQLTEDGIGGSSANFKLPPLGPDANEAFIVTFDLKLESEGQPADGFSFNYGNIADSATAGEEGFSSGLAVEFDTWDNGGEGQESGIGYDISVDGADLPDGVMRFSLTRQTLTPILTNNAASLFALAGDLRLIEFHSKANALTDESMQIVAAAFHHHRLS